MSQGGYDENLRLLAALFVYVIMQDSALKVQVTYTQSDI